MLFERIAGISIYRPRKTTIDRVEAEAERHLRSRYGEGVYTDSVAINAIIHHQFAFYIERLNRLLPSIASPELLRILFAQYDRSTELYSLRSDNKLSDTQRSQWETIGPTFRRALKYLAERVTLFASEELPRLRIVSEEEMTSLLDEILLCAERLVDYYELSDQTFLLFPQNTILEIHPRGRSTKYWTLRLDASCPDELRARIRTDMENRNRFVPDFEEVRSINVQDQYLGDAFHDTFGMRYRDALEILLKIIRIAPVPPKGAPTPSVDRQEILDKLPEASGYPRESIDRIVSGFSITKENMLSEGREIWKPKQEYRALRRGFFVIPDPTGIYLLFSRGMAEECLMKLGGDVVFKHLPPEWRSESINLALNNLSQEAGHWLERVVAEKLKDVGIVGIYSINRGIGQGASRVLIPPDVGEIDYLGYSSSERLLAVAECKLVNAGSEPKHFRDDISDFVTKADSYLVKFRRKVAWVRENAEIVFRALQSVLGQSITTRPVRLAAAMITLYPTMASCFIHDFPCVTITEIMMGYEKLSKWPFETGLTPITGNHIQ